MEVRCLLTPAKRPRSPEKQPDGPPTAFSRGTRWVGMPPGAVLRPVRGRVPLLHFDEARTRTPFHHTPTLMMLPSGETVIPGPCRLPFRHSPSRRVPSGSTIVPFPWGTPLRTSPSTVRRVGRDRGRFGGGGWPNGRAPARPPCQPLSRWIGHRGPAPNRLAPGSPDVRRQRSAASGKNLETIHGFVPLWE